jgi:hypothetical protein
MLQNIYNLYTAHPEKCNVWGRYKWAVSKVYNCVTFVFEALKKDNFIQQAEAFGQQYDIDEPDQPSFGYIVCDLLCTMEKAVKGVAPKIVDNNVEF